MKAQSFSVNGAVTCFTLELCVYIIWTKLEYCWIQCVISQSWRKMGFKIINLCIQCFFQRLSVWLQKSLDEFSYFHHVFSFPFLPQIFAIFAFSTCGSYSGMFKMSVECKNRSESDLGIEVEFEYPFRYAFCHSQVTVVVIERKCRLLQTLNTHWTHVSKETGQEPVNLIDGNVS